MAPIVLGYWDIRGFGQPIRLLLEHAGADWVEEAHHLGGPPDFSRQHWLDLKPTLPLDFPNLPYLYDGDVRISQSLAIQRYLARKFGLDGKTEQERIRIDLAEQQIHDYRTQGFFVYSDDFDKLVDGIRADLPNKLTALSKFLGSHHYFSGGSVSHADFMAYEWLDQQNLFVPSILSQFPNLKEFTHRIEQLPKVKAYMSSDRFIKFPINNNQAKWGSRSHPL
jgi:glutathione S-transferase